LLSAVWQRWAEDPRAIRGALQAVLRRKGLLAEFAGFTRLELVAGRAQGATQLVSEWTELRKTLGEAHAGGSAGDRRLGGAFRGPR
jgi:hypothetical protein